MRSRLSLAKLAALCVCQRSAARCAGHIMIYFCGILTANLMINNVISPEFNEDGRALRRVRSFVRRQGRLTKRQEDALTDLWPSAGVDFTGTAGFYRAVRA